MRAASSLNVQRLRPSGGFWQAKAIRWASPSPSNVRLYCRRGLRRSNAASRPSSTNPFRTRSTVALATSTPWAMASSPQPGPSGPASAFSRILACISLRAAALPRESISCSIRRSAPVNVTIYFFFIAGLLAWVLSISSAKRPDIIHLIISNRALVLYYS